MAMSKEAREAVEAIRRDLSVHLTTEILDKYYDVGPKLKTVVELRL